MIVRILPIPKICDISFTLLFKGKKQSLIAEWVDEFLNDFFKRDVFYQPAIACLKEAQKDAHLTMLMSTSPIFIVSAIAKRLHIDICHATSYTLDSNGCYLEVEKALLPTDKAAFLALYAKRFHLMKEDLAAYSDSYIDLPMLKEAGSPVGVNPDRFLLAYCERRKWKVI